MNYSTELLDSIIQLAHDNDLAAIKRIVKSHSKSDLNLTGTLEKSLNTACVHGYLKMAEYKINIHFSIKNSQNHINFLLIK